LVKVYDFKNIPVEVRENYYRSIFESLNINECSLGLLKVIIPAQTVAKKHYHKEHFEIFIFLNGEGEIKIESTDGTRQYKISKGTIMIVYPGEKHEVKALNEPLEILAIKIPFKPEDKVVEG